MSPNLPALMNSLAAMYFLPERRCEPICSTEPGAKPEVEKALGHEVETFGSDVALYEAKDRLGLDAVIISTADFQHAQHAVHAVEAGCDAYCEKPIAEDMY